MFIKRVFRKTARKVREVGLLRAVKWFWVCTKIKCRMMKCASGDYYYIRQRKQQKEYMISKDLPSIFIMAGVPYYDIGGGQRSSQLANTFNKMGYRVYYFYAFNSSESTVFSAPMPLCAHHIIEDDTAQRIRNLVHENDIFLIESPCRRFSSLLDLAIEKKCRIVYESIDNWETSLGSTVFSEVMLRRLLTAADVTVGTAKPLVRQLEKYLMKYGIEDKPVLYLPNAVDDELFCSKKKHETPDDMKSGRVTLLYFGSLWGEWFDWELIFELAKKHPEYCINLIGDYSAIPEKVKAAPYNVRFLGLKAHGDLPAYLANADYGIIPFKCGAISDYVSPLKIFEYISMGAKVLSTALPDIEGYPNVYVGNTADEWEKSIAEPREVEDHEGFTDKNSWHARADALLDGVLENRECSICSKLAVVVLNHNNKNVIFRCVESLIKHGGGCEIIVVDNCSNDGSFEMLREYGDKITLLRNSKNGCASGRNLGVANTEKEYILFLDSDQWVTGERWLSAYETVMEKAPTWGLIGWAAGFFDRDGKAHHVVDSFAHRYMPPNSIARCDVGYLGSGGMLIRREDFLAVGGFDISYDPTCYEDTDISLKIRDMGKELYYCPYLGIVHLPHQTTKSGSSEHRAMTKKKQEYFTEKWKRRNPALLKYIK